MPGFEAVVSVDEVAKKQGERGSPTPPADPSDVEEERSDVTLRRKNLTMDSSDLLSTLTEDLSSLAVKEEDAVEYSLPAIGFATLDSAYKSLNLYPDVPDRQDDLEGLARSDGSSASSTFYSSSSSSPGRTLHDEDDEDFIILPRTTSCASLSLTHTADAIPERASRSMLELGTSLPTGPALSNKRSFAQWRAPGSFFKASTEVFRGVGAGVFGGGVPMSV